MRSPETSSASRPAGAGSPQLRMWVRLLACAKIGEKRLRRRFDDEFDTTLPRFDVMAALDRSPEGLRMSDLSRALLVSNGNVTLIVRQLQERGLVEVKADPQDGRSAIVTLSAEGRERFLMLAEAHHRWIEELFAELPEAKVKDLAGALGDVRAILSREG